MNPEMFAFGKFLSYQAAVQFTHGVHRQIWQDGERVVEFNRKTQRFHFEVRGGKFVNVRVTDRIDVKEVDA